MAEKGKEKVTMMKLKVDLDCAKCYKKVKKVLSKIPQIRDQLFDEKSNIVIIKVVCCSPERLMDKLCYKGGGSIKTIEIIEPSKPPPVVSKQPPPPPPVVEPPPPPPVVPKPPVQPPPVVPKPPIQPPPVVPKPPVQPPPVVSKQPPPPPWAPMMPLGQPIPMCCWPCYDGFGGGPAFYGYGMLLPQPYKCYGRPIYDSWGCGPPPSYRPCHLSRCSFFCEENPQSCSIM
ncbi:unnamed protein product [Eruca vesicaria subsp. sativa]|uniref:Uncharacterized protein n=1 Tax=Eruca vesicaria subsp. sativa TaxID=29727 RepID=A0ABC8JEW0_ERUVS|nr:unnamed protein product [Eruca vesicaria subsp. sativa]